MDYVNTIFRTTSFHFFFARRTLYKQQVAIDIRAIGMGVTNCPTLMTVRNNFIADIFS